MNWIYLARLHFKANSWYGIFRLSCRWYVRRKRTSFCSIRWWYYSTCVYMVQICQKRSEKWTGCVFFVISANNDGLCFNESTKIHSQSDDIGSKLPKSMTTLMENVPKPSTVLETSAQSSLSIVKKHRYFRSTSSEATMVLDIHRQYWTINKTITTTAKFARAKKKIEISTQTHAQRPTNE